MGRKVEEAEEGADCYRSNCETKPIFAVLASGAMMESCGTSAGSANCNEGLAQLGPGASPPETDGFVPVQTPSTRRPSPVQNKMQASPRMTIDRIPLLCPRGRPTSMGLSELSFEKKVRSPYRESELRLFR